jgi:hypothetical protein
VAPPVIVPRNVSLGSYFDGDIVNIILDVVEFEPSAYLSWSVKSGTLPPGLMLSSTGILQGYIQSVPAGGPAGQAGWDNTSWDEDYLTTSNNIAILGWDFPAGAASKTFSFTVEVNDGVNYDLSTYTILVLPRSALTADGTVILASQSIVNNKKLSVDTGPRHLPIIETTQADLIPVREGSYFSFQVQALDLDGDVLQYSVPALNSGAFDEQYFVGNSVPYIESTLTNGSLYTGVFPKTSITHSAASIQLFLGNAVTANVGDTITQAITSANATVTANVVNSLSIPIVVNYGVFSSGSGNLALNGQYLHNSSNVSVFPQSVNLGVSTTVDNTSPALLPNDLVQILAPDPSTNDLVWYDGTVSSQTIVRLTGNAIITANAGSYLTHSSTGANAAITSVSATTGTLYLGGNLLAGTISIAGSSVITANVGDIITQASSGANATVTSAVLGAISVPVIFTVGTFATGPTTGNLKVNGSNVIAYANTITTSLLPVTFSANVGDIITQSGTGANATVLVAQPGGTSVAVTFNSNVFTIGSGNIKVNGGNVKVYPTGVTTRTDITATYTNSYVFKLNTSGATNVVYINGVSTNSTPTSIVAVGITLGGESTQGTVGFDQGKFDQGVLSLPSGLNIDINSGWLTGVLPSQTINEIDYNFEVSVYKRDYFGYISSYQYQLQVLGDLNNTINWLTPSNLGSIENGKVSDLYVEAISSKGKPLVYSLSHGSNYNDARNFPGYTLQANSVQGHTYTITVNSYQFPNSYSPASGLELPQGLKLTPQGYISGRVSFEVFSLDSGTTTFDVNSLTLNNPTTFDHTYTFNVTATDYDQTVSAMQTFTLVVNGTNLAPYENLYLKAQLNSYQKTEFQQITQDPNVFPLSLIYRHEDPWFGIPSDINTLFLAGLNPSTVAAYTSAVSTNNFIKRILFNNIKTAIVTDPMTYDVVDIATGTTIGTYNDTIKFVPTDFSLGYTVANTIPNGSKLTTEHVKYEVVYVEIEDENTNALGQGPANVIDLTNVIANPYYSSANVAYTVAYPNSFENMSNVMVSAIGYANKEALPDWMTSKQANGTVLGFKRAVVLAYTQPGASETIAWRLGQKSYNLNELNFTVDQYLLDDNYTANYDIASNAFITSTETTFDRFSILSSLFNKKATVDYAVNLSFENINERLFEDVIHTGVNINGTTIYGLDGITDFKDGDTMVFFQQEFTGDPNSGWSDVTSLWDSVPWDDNAPTVPWDSTSYVPGYNDHLLNPTVPNERIGIWRINVSIDSIVTLTFIESMSYYDTLYVRRGYTHGSTNIYYDPIIKPGHSVPNYSVIPQQIKTISTTFDKGSNKSGGTKFYSYRDLYSVPEQGDKYIKFAKTGVFT